jgi:hypothetical protein
MRECDGGCAGGADGTETETATEIEGDEDGVTVPGGVIDGDDARGPLRPGGAGGAGGEGGDVTTPPRSGPR